MYFYFHWFILRLVHSKNEQGSATIETVKKLYSPIPSAEQKIGKCPICKKENVPLVLYHIFKKVIFGSYRTNSVEYICRECKHNIHQSIKVMENEVLQKFTPVYWQIWEFHISKRHLPTRTIVGFIEEQLKKVYIGSSSRANLEIYEDQCEEPKKIMGKCEICKKEGELTKHHPEKRSVFGENNRIVFPCRGCHDLVEKAVTRFERMVLRKFSQCNKEIWKTYINNGFISDDDVRELARGSLIILMERKGLLTTSIEAHEATIAVEGN